MAGSWMSFNCTSDMYLRDKSKILTARQKLYDIIALNSGTEPVSAKIWSTKEMGKHAYRMIPIDKSWYVRGDEMEDVQQ